MGVTVTFVTPGHACPYCGQPATGNAPAPEAGQDPLRPPEPDDFVVCVFCYRVGVYGPDLRPRAARRSELEIFRGMLPPGVMLTAGGKVQPKGEC